MIKAKQEDAIVQLKRELLLVESERARLEGEAAVTSRRYTREQREMVSRDFVRAATEFIADDINGRDVLEIGCGIGRFAEFAITRAASLTCIDICPEMIQRHKDRLGIHASRVQYRQMFMQDYYRVPPHDVGLCMHVLNHQKDLLLQPFVEAVEQSVRTLFVLDLTDANAKVSSYTEVHTEDQILALFTKFQLACRQRYQNPVYPFRLQSFLKLVR